MITDRKVLMSDESKDGRRRVELLGNGRLTLAVTDVFGSWSRDYDDTHNGRTLAIADYERAL